MNYTLHQLRVFLKVVECKSITRASDALFMTQPAVSMQIKNFQDQFEIPLIEVIKKKIHITDFGYEVAQIAERILMEVDEIEQKESLYKGSLKGKLSIASASTGKYIMPYFLSDFLHSYTEIDLTLDVTNKISVIESLLNNEVDFALVSVVPEDIDVEEQFLIENKLYLVSSSPDYDDKMPFIFREKGSATRASMEKYFGSVAKEKRMELTSNEAIKQAVVAGLGNSIMPLIGLKNELKSGELHVIRKKSLPIITNWRLIWKKNKNLSPISQTYLEYVRDNRERIIKEKFEWYQKFNL